MRALEFLSFGALALAAHLFAALWLLDGTGAKAADQPADRALALARAGLAQTIAAWEAPPPVAPAPEALAPTADLSEPTAMAASQPVPSTPLPAVSAPPAMDAAASIALPPLRPPLSQALALPDAAPVIASPLLLSQSERPAARPARPVTPQPRREAAEPAGQQRSQQTEQQAAPTRQPAAPAASAPSGSAGGGGSGRGQAATPKLGAAQLGQLMAQWGAQIQRCIGRRAQAPRDIRQGGQVVLNLQIGRNGAIQGVGIARSSGVAALDQAAVDAARGVGRCPAAPRVLDAASYPFQLPINLR